jgi:FlaA1/EpsC-like NDP-sugar epimerase
MINLNKSLISYFFEILIGILSLFLSFNLRYNFNIPDFTFQVYIYLSLITALIIAFFVFFLKINKFSWRATSLNQYKSFLILYFFSTLFILLISKFFIQNIVTPLSIFILYPLIYFSFSFLLKFCYQLFFNLNLKKRSIRNSIEIHNTIIIGIDTFDNTILRSLSNIPNINILGIFDNDKNKIGRLYSGIKVIGNLKSLTKYLSDIKVHRIIIDSSSITNIDTIKIFKLAGKYSIELFEIPNLEDIISKKLTINKINNIDLNDLLGRSNVEFNFEEFNHFANDKVIAISGAGGSIGSEIAKQISKLKCKKLLLIDNSEFNLYKISQLLSNSKIIIHSYLCDIQNINDLSIIFEENKPDIFYHAAAYKHVPLLEIDFNSYQAYKNNILGTQNLINLCSQFNIEKFILVSSDKAVNPTNFMGATKRLAELMCLKASVKSKTDYIIVRFGNVLGSSGSVIPLFINQINTSREITITDKRIERFFMSIVEASQLVISTTNFGKSGDIFILDMGRSIKIIDLARDLIRYLGYKISNIKIKYIGLRPGEKLYEELFYNYEVLSKTKLDKIKVVNIDENVLKELIKDIDLSNIKINPSNIKQTLKKIIKEYI